MTSRFILDKFNLDLSSSRLLVRLGFLFVFVVLAVAVDRVVVVDKRVIAHGGGGATGRIGMPVCGRRSS
jgi:hypothetical protein